MFKLMCYPEWVLTANSRDHNFGQQWVAAINEMRAMVSTKRENRDYSTDAIYASLTRGQLLRMMFNCRADNKLLAEFDTVSDERLRQFVRSRVETALHSLHYPATYDLHVLAANTLNYLYPEGENRYEYVLADDEDCFKTQWMVMAEATFRTAHYSLDVVNPFSVKSTPTRHQWMLMVLWTDAIAADIMKASLISETATHLMAQMSNIRFGHLMGSLKGDFTYKPNDEQWHQNAPHLNITGGVKRDRIALIGGDTTAMIGAKHLLDGISLATRAPEIHITYSTLGGPIPNGQGRTERGPTSTRSGKETYRSPKGNVYPRPRTGHGRGRSR